MSRRVKTQRSSDLSPQERFPNGRERSDGLDFIVYTYSGVGLPKVFRKSPATRFWGERYIFSNSSGLMESDPEVWIFLNAVSGSMLLSRW